ncbi:type VII secretion target [Nocardia sp. NPDC050712]|uniref:type VII secretion target n=1 Tax=Nocardia sp. NPDC050712 TaxID=3155518 RepID=UPI0033DD8967
MADSVNVDASKLATHATNLGKLTDPLSMALQAAQAVSAPTDAYGKICAFLPPLFVDSVETEGVDAIQAAIDAVAEDAAKLKKVADGFTATDTANAAKTKAQTAKIEGPAS